MIYRNDKISNEMKILGKEFVKNNNNKRKCNLLINNKKYDICEYIEYDKYDINKNDDLITIILIGIHDIINAMSYGCRSLKSLPDIPKWDIKNVLNMSYIFSKCISLQSFPDISKLNIRNITNMSYMFSGCSSLQLLPYISKWNTRNI